MLEGYVEGWMETGAGKVPIVSARLSRSDMLGTVRVRLAFRRMDYRVRPGLYAVGNPDGDSIVLVSANFKLSFDVLRKELEGLNAWILVLDTKGINVWCAAGKGTFGTEELVRRIDAAGLSEIVSHRELLVPQLGAPGIAAHEVKRASGFRVVYGPVRASDIRAFLEAGMKATPEMRRVTFHLVDRARLVPTEVIGSLRYLLLAGLIFFLMGGLDRSGYSVVKLVNFGVPSLLNLVSAYLVGTTLGLVLLPWVPGRAFSFKGFVLGVGLVLVLFLTGLARGRTTEMLGWALLIPAICSFIVLNLTGTSTYTSLSGVKKEMRIAVPLEIAGAAVGCALWITGRFL